MARRAFGAPSARPPSSTTGGATATNAAACSATPDGFTVWYEADDAVGGVLTHNGDTDYELGARLIAEH
ncbi:hypothetical protein [Mycobacterium sp.]|uniref:hypothetical protein n=1 Tax=Mycobacterium sp. TaxID=1785 RepID=UPI003341932B